MEDQMKMSEWIDSYTNGELKGMELTAFANRMKKSPLLRAEVRLDAEIDEVLSDAHAMEFMTKVQAARNRAGRGGRGLFLMMLAASVVVLIGLAGYLLTLRGTFPGYSSVNGLTESARCLYPSGHGSIRGKRAEMISAITPVGRRERIRAEQLMARYQPLPEYELLAGGSIRSGSLALILSPDRKAFPQGSEIVIKWKPLVPPTPLLIEVTDNRGRTVLVSPPLHGESFTMDSGVLPRGLYYYRILSGDEMIVMGRFTLL
jgi:hypothetical protein